MSQGLLLLERRDWRMTAGGKKNPPNVLYFFYEDKRVFSEVQKETKNKQKTQLIRISLRDGQKMLNALAKAGNRVSGSSNVNALFLQTLFITG